MRSLDRLHLSDWEKRQLDSSVLQLVCLHVTGSVGLVQGSDRLGSLSLTSVLKIIKPTLIFAFFLELFSDWLSVVNS